jgi:hypothetical protein
MNLIDPLKKAFVASGLIFPVGAPASKDQIEEILTLTGISLPREMTDLYSYSNGSNRKPWFVLKSRDFSTLEFETISWSLKRWTRNEAYYMNLLNDEFSNDLYGEKHGLDLQKIIRN